MRIVVKRGVVVVVVQCATTEDRGRGVTIVVKRGVVVVVQCATTEDRGQSVRRVERSDTQLTS